MRDPITKLKIKFPRKSRKVRKRYKAVKVKEVNMDKKLKITTRALVAAGILEDKYYTATELGELLVGGGSIRSLVIKLPKTYSIKKYMLGAIEIKRKVGCYYGKDIYNIVSLRELGKIPRKPKANYDDNTGKLPSTLHLNKKRKNRKILKIRCEHCGCEIPKGHRKPRILSYTEMLRESGKFSGVLTMRRLRESVLRGRRSYVRDRE